MPIYLPESTQTSTESLTPRQIVAELDKYVIGQAAAKRAVAIALRNRMRRQKVSPEMAEEIAPKNILMIGPTGVGKTEIARRLARLAQSPFVKVEASATEVSYVGRDVESMVRDLVELGVDMVRAQRSEKVRGKASHNAEGTSARHSSAATRTLAPDGGRRARSARSRHATFSRTVAAAGSTRGGRDRFERGVSVLEIIAGSSVEEVDINLKRHAPGPVQGKTRKRRMKVPEALEFLTQEEEQKLIDMDRCRRRPLSNVSKWIISTDEIDRLPGVRDRLARGEPRGRSTRHPADYRGHDRQHQKHGMVRTDHILFIAAGAFPRVQTL